LLLAAGTYGFKLMTSVYKQDFGNGVIVYADAFVRTGKWVYNCRNSRLVSRQPLIAPITELRKEGKLTIGDMYSLSSADRAQAIATIKATTQIDDWYNKLLYLTSGLDENSNLANHDFDLLIRHDGRTWAVIVSQSLLKGYRSNFTITAEPYDPNTYMDYNEMLKAAAASCPIPQ
jgi:hypothetical protein